MLDDEPDVAVVGDVETTTQEVEGQDYRQVVAGTKVTDHTETKAPGDTVEVTAPADTKMTALDYTEVTPLVNTNVIALTLIESPIYTNRWFP